MIKKPKRDMWLGAGCMALALLFIWGNSVLSADRSSALSGYVKDLINTLWSGKRISSDDRLRKLAHLAEYAGLGVVIGLLPGRARRAPLSLRLLCGLLTGLADETIQLFSAERGGCLADVWLDLAGYCAGLTMLWAIRLAAKAVRRRRPPGDPPRDA